MRKVLKGGLAMLLVMCSAATLRAQDVSQADKDRALAYLESTKKGVMDATKGLSDAQWNFKAGPDRWSIAEVMEHLAAAEDLIRGMDQEQVMKSPAISPRDPAELKKIDDGVVAQVPDRSHKISSARTAEAHEPLWHACRRPKAFSGEPSGDRGIFENDSRFAGACC